MSGQTISEKILARSSGNDTVRPGQIVDGIVDLLYMHEMLAMALIPFGEIGTAAVWDPSKIVVTLDHWVPPPTPEIAKMHQTIREFCHRQGIQRFHDVGDHGIVHQLIARGLRRIDRLHHRQSQGSEVRTRTSRRSTRRHGRSRGLPRPSSEEPPGRLGSPSSFE